MAVKLVTERRTKELGEIVDAQAEYVSLVKYAANRQGIRVMKSEKKGSHMRFINSVLVPKGATLEELLKVEGFGFLHDLNKESPITGEDYTEYVHTPREKFDASTLRIRKLGDKGILAIAGNLKNGEKAEGGAILLPDNPAASVLATEEATREYSFAQLFFKELDAFVGTFESSMKQSQLPPEARKSTIMSSLDSFRSFVSMALDAVGASTNKAEKEALLKVIKDVQRILVPNDTVGDLTDNEGGWDMSELFKTKEEFIETLNSVIDAKLAGRLPEPVDPEKEKAEAEKAKAAAELAELKAKMEKTEAASLETNSKLEASQKKIEELSAALATRSHSNDEPTHGDRMKDKQEKWEEFPAGVPKEHRDGVFHDVLFDWEGIDKRMKELDQ